MTRGCISNPVGQNKWKKKLFLSFYFSIFLSRIAFQQEIMGMKESLVKKENKQEGHPLSRILLWKTLVREGLLSER
jgi:hypothetical protein